MHIIIHIGSAIVRSIFFCLAVFVSLPSMCQINTSVENEYDFETRANTLVKAMSEAKSEGKSTEFISTELSKYNLGKSLMGRTFNILIIDSAVVEYNHISELYKDFAITLETNKDNTFSSSYTTPNGARRLLTVIDEGKTKRLAESVKMGMEAWSRPVVLTEFAKTSGSMNFPFLSSDGRSLYYSLQNETTLGGYDIFVSYFDENTCSFTKGINIGFPFNSPYNDFLFVWDDKLEYGKFATDRNTPKGYACVYTFVKADSTKFCHNMSKEDQLHYLRTCQHRTDSLTDSINIQLQNKARYAINPKINEGKSEKSSQKFYIADDLIYNDINDFKSPNAARIATELHKQEQTLRSKQLTLESMRKDYHKSPSKELKSQILSLESDVEKLETTIENMQKNIRKAELNN